MSVRFISWLRRWRHLPLFHRERPRRRNPLKSIYKSLDFQRQGVIAVYVYDQLNRICLSAFPRDTETVCNETQAR